MKHHILKTPNFMGGFTDLFLLGITRGALGVSDFTAGATTQAWNMDAIAIGDAIVFPCTHIDVVQAIAGAGPVTAATLSVGHTGATTAFNNVTDIFATTPTTTKDPIAATVPITRATASGYLTCDIVLTGGNASGITAGDIWIFVALSRYADRVTLRQV